jgi:putative transposase
VPKAGWVRFRWSRPVPPGGKSYRVTRDRAGRWHVAFAAIPEPVPAPGNSQMVGIDRGVTVSAALSTGELLHAPGLTADERADRRKDWAEKTSTGIARRFDVIRIEDLRITAMTRSARGTLQKPGRNVSAKAGLNRGILGSGWGLLGRRLEQKAPGRVEKIKPAFTSQRCSACGQDIAAGHAVTARGGFRDAGPVNREPQALAS